MQDCIKTTIKKTQEGEIGISWTYIVQHIHSGLVCLYSSALLLAPVMLCLGINKMEAT